VLCILYYIALQSRVSMNDSIERTNENSKEPTIRVNNNENQEAIISGHTKNCMDKAVTERSIDGDPTRSDE
jgi:hypothetical protein